MSRSLVGSSSTSRSAGWSISGGEVDARLLAAREAADRHVELLGRKQEAPRPAGDVDRLAAEHDLIALRRERAAERQRRDRAALRCWSSMAMRSPSARSTRPASGARSPVRSRMSVDLPLPFGPRSPRRVPGAEDEAHVVEQAPLAEALGDVLGDDETLGPPLGRAEVDRRGALAPAGSARSPARRSAGPPPGCAPATSSCAPSARRRSQSTSRRTRLASVSCQRACSRSAASFRSRNSL